MARTRAGMTPKTDIQFYDTPQLAVGRFISHLIQLSIVFTHLKIQTIENLAIPLLF
jgi:hypothetical protein